MGFIQKVEYKFSTKHFLIYLLLVHSISFNVVKCEALQDTCPSECMCESSYGSRTISVTCTELELIEIPTVLSSQSVKSFDVSNNILTHIKELVFKDYDILETLLLSGNAIELIDSRAFNGLKMLLNIDLSYNNLRHITPDMFSDTPLLETISFRGNPLVYFPDSSPILVSPSIISLDLSYCSLTSVNSHTFSQLPSLQVLDLSSNNLQEFSRDILNTLPEIAVIDFGNNLWKCDCNIVKVLNWFSERRKSKGLPGEHNPVKCVAAGVLKTIWTAASKHEFCPGETGVFSEAGIISEATSSMNPPKILESTKQTMVLTEPPVALGPKKIKKGSSSLENLLHKLLSGDSIAFLVFVVLPLMLAATTMVTIVTVNCVTDFIKSRRKNKIPPVLKDSIGSSKAFLFSKIPLLSSSESSELFTEKRFSASGASIGCGSYTEFSDHLYQTIE